jgi:hypothetical protein
LKIYLILRRIQILKVAAEEAVVCVAAFGFDDVLLLG